MTVPQGHQSEWRTPSSLCSSRMTPNLLHSWWHREQAVPVMTAELMTCLSTLSPQDIEVATPALGEMVLSVRRDGTVIPTNLEEVVQTKSFLSFPSILGINNHEYGWMLPHFFLFPGWDLGMTRENMMILVFMLQKLHLPDSAPGIIVEEYFGDMKDPVGIRDASLELMGDLLIVVPGV
ncbi:carboxylesterase 3-like isoform X2 [Salmo trutta]|uniref:carboxylesterase 3-like isoform X2 n=1 Tax=Salmo trutta TaxID=8032 RepID=UPI001131683B|nr:carboxylesterase 3-like isoform X2 [Salmo trutta]